MKVLRGKDQVGMKNDVVSPIATSSTNPALSPHAFETESTSTSLKPSVLGLNISAALYCKARNGKY